MLTLFAYYFAVFFFNFVNIFYFMCLYKIKIRWYHNHCISYFFYTRSRNKIYSFITDVRNFEFNIQLSILFHTRLFAISNQLLLSFHKFQFMIYNSKFIFYCKSIVK